MTELLKINYGVNCDNRCENCPYYFQCESERKFLIYDRGRMDLVREKMAKIKHKIAVIGGKGGVGKSTVSCNLAVSLAREHSVTIIDSDFDGPSIPRILGLIGKNLTIERSGIIPVPGPAGLRAVSTGFMLDDNEATIWFQDLKRQALEEFLSHIDYGEDDYLILDLPPGTSSETVNVFKYLPDLDGVVVVTIPSELSQNVARRAIGLCKQAGAKVIGVIENMSGFICPDCGKEVDILRRGGGEDLAKTTMVPFLGKIPLDARISETSDAGTPFIHEYADSKIAQLFNDIVEKVKMAVK